MSPMTNSTALPPHDVTDQNFNAKVSGPMGQQALQTALRRQPELMFELAREKLRRPSRDEK